MNREQLIQLLEDVRTQQYLLDVKEETLQTMRSIAIEAIHADDARRKVLVPLQATLIFFCSRKIA